MKKIITNSIVASDKSEIVNATIQGSQVSSENHIDGDTSITNSILANSNSKISNAQVNIEKEKKKSFWNGFSIGSIITSVIASGIWYLIQKFISN